MKHLLLVVPILFALSHGAVAEPNGEISTAAGIINNGTGLTINTYA